MICEMLAVVSPKHVSRETSSTPNGHGFFISLHQTAPSVNLTNTITHLPSYTNPSIRHHPSKPSPSSPTSSPSSQNSHHRIASKLSTLPSLRLTSPGIRRGQGSYISASASAVSGSASVSARCCRCRCLGGWLAGWLVDWLAGWLRKEIGLDWTVWAAWGWDS